MRSLLYATLIATLVTAPFAPAEAKLESGEAKLARLTAGRTPGKTVDCINIGLTGMNDSEKLPGIGMAYRQGTTWYVSHFDSGCPELRDDTILITRLHASRLCRGDIADLRMSGANIPVGSCIFGDFTPYTRPKG
jgi:hypothetical protein